jgi:hypothetical protein
MCIATHIFPNVKHRWKCDNAKDSMMPAPLHIGLNPDEKVNCYKPKLNIMTDIMKQ